MASGPGKNQDDNETREPVDSLRQREESNAAAATEPPPSAPLSQIFEEEEEVHGPPEAGGRNPSAATATATAAAAEQKGEETVSLFSAAWGSAGGKPPLPPRPPSFSRAGGSSAAFDLKDVSDELMLECQRERRGETDQKAEAEGTPTQQNEQVNSPALWPKKGKKTLWRKKRNEDARCGVCTSGRRRINLRRIFLITILIFFCHLPTARGFQRYDLDAVANELRAPEYQMHIQQALAAQEAQEASRLNRVLWQTAGVVLFLAFLVGNIIAGANNGQEEVKPHEAQAPDIGRGSDLLLVVLILFSLVMVTAALRVVLRGRL